MVIIDFPYKKNTLDGVFKLGVRTGKLNIKYQVNLSTTFANVFPASLCFDGNTGTFCHTYLNAKEPQYLQIYFEEKFKIEGFAILNRNYVNWDPLNYDIEGSNNGENFETIKSFNENQSIACGHMNNRTYKLNTKNRYNYFRLTTTGAHCNETKTDYGFNMAEFDLFGTFNEKICKHETRKGNMCLHHLQYFLFLVYS